jgi:hypothetical protein
MKNIVWLVSGCCAALAAVVLWESSRPRPVDELAHRLEEAWADHHTVA